MRRVTIALMVGLLLSLLVAAPALAQLRDPFEPLVDPNAPTADGSGTNGDGTADPATDGSGTDGDGVAGAPSEPLANTGADSEDWLALAYVLIALGVGTVALTWFSRRQPLPSRPGR